MAKKTCVGCGGAMVVGGMLGGNPSGFGAGATVSWAPFQTDDSGRVRDGTVSRMSRKTVFAYRCRKCGRIDLYA